MVSMSDLVTEGDDDLMAEFFTYDETPSPVSYQQPLQHEPLKKPNMAQATNERENTTQDSTIEDTDGQGSSKLQQKLKEVDTFVQNYSVRIMILTSNTLIPLFLGFKCTATRSNMEQNRYGIHGRFDRV